MVTNIITKFSTSCSLHAASLPLRPMLESQSASPPPSLSESLSIAMRSGAQRYQYRIPVYIWYQVPPAMIVPKITEVSTVVSCVNRYVR